MLMKENRGGEMRAKSTATSGGVSSKRARVGPLRLDGRRGDSHLGHTASSVAHHLTLAEVLKSSHHHLSRHSTIYVVTAPSKSSQHHLSRHTTI